MANALPHGASVTSKRSSSEGSLEDKCRSVDHSKSVLETLNELRGNAMLCDVILRVGDQAFPAHKCVLAAFSPYFKAMFTSQLKESHDREVVLNGIEPLMLEALLQFAYTGSVSINQANMEGLMAASNLLQVLWVRDACSRFMEKHIDASNCLGIFCFAETMNCERLQKMAKTHALSNFTDVAAHEEFLNLPHARLVELVSSDALDVPREEDVFTAVLNWFNHQPDARKEEFHKVLEKVRLPLVSPYFLHDNVASLEMMRSSPECHRLLEEARQYHQLPDRRGDMQGARTRPRGNAALVDVIVCVGGHGGQGKLDSVQAFDPASNQWASLAKLPFAVGTHGCVVTGKNVLYVAGGEASSGITNKLLRFYPHLNKWLEMASCMSVARSSHGMAVLDGFVYAVGGRGGAGELNAAERFNAETKVWEQLPGVKAGISRTAVVAYDGCVYVTGGCSSKKNVARVERFDPRTRTWSEVAPMLSPRDNSVACVLNGKLYVIGGRDAKQYTNAVDCYDGRKNQWSPCSPLRVRRCVPGVAVMNGHIYVFGGVKETGTFLESVERYNPSTDRWEDVTDMPSARWGLACAVLQVRRSLLVSGKQ